jgi:putative hydrolase of the HAD superfamily
MSSDLVLIVDADNTLWDTDDVFADAQRAMIDALERHGHVLPGDKLAFLREVDGRMFEYHGRFEYDFRMLPEALIQAVAQGHADIDPGIVPVLDEPSSDAVEAYEAFSSTLETTKPDLLPGVRELVDWLRAANAAGEPRVASILVSEGEQGRLTGIARHHNLDEGVFDSVHILPGKDQHSFKTAVAEGRAILGDPCAQAVSIGDSLKRDIGPSKAAGCVTIYKPHGFHGQEAAGTPEEEPDHTVGTVHEALEIIQGLLAKSEVPA